MKRTTVYLALGSNIGERGHNLRRALELLSQRVTIEKVSPLYDTAPAGNTDQARFLNAVCRGCTSLAPEDLLSFIKDIEQQMGRQPGPPNSPRQIDVDILFYGRLVIDTPQLKIPHPRLSERAFVIGAPGSHCASAETPCLG